MALRALVLDRPPPVPFAISRATIVSRFRRANLAVAAAHAAQSVVMIAFGADLSARLTDGAAGAPQSVSVGFALGVFFGALALGHAASATLLHSVYIGDLRQGRNSLRWAVTYTTAPITMVLIASLAGIRESGQLLLVMCATFAMVVFGSLQERLNPPGSKQTTLVPLGLAMATGLVPWVLIAAHVVDWPSGGAPGATFMSLFVLWVIPWVNVILQYRQVGPWADFLYGERTALLISLVVSSALAWQIVVSSAML